MAEFLVECLVADALLLEQWGHDDPLVAQRESSQSVDKGPMPAATRPVALEEGSAALERRRQLNRDSMRRTRQKTRRDVDRMRETLTTLAQEFDALCERQRLTQRSAELAQLEDSYAQLAETSHRLKAEKFHLERILMEHEKSRQRIAIDVDDRFHSDYAEDWDEPATQYFEYSDITKAQAQTAISTSYQRVMELEQTARPLSDWVGSEGNPMRTFGWSVKCEISSGHNFFLSMTKRLAFRPEEAMELSWAFIMRDRRQDDHGPTRRVRRIVRSDVLQVLGDNMCVVGNDWYHPVKPGVRMRTIGLRFRTKTDNGLALGLSTVNPQDLVRRSACPAVEYRDGFTWHDYVADGDGCVATFRSLVQYNTQENLHLRLVNMMSLYWQWEGTVLHCPVQVLNVQE